jgi:hypothetical protein
VGLRLVALALVVGAGVAGDKNGRFLRLADFFSFNSGHGTSQRRPTNLVGLNRLSANVGPAKTKTYKWFKLAEVGKRLMPNTSAGVGGRFLLVEGSVAWLSASRRLGCQPGCGADSARQCWLGLAPAANNESTGQLGGAVSSSIFDV